MGVCSSGLPYMLHKLQRCAISGVMPSTSSLYVPNTGVLDAASRRRKTSPTTSLKRTLVAMDGFARPDPPDSFSNARNRCFRAW